MAQPNRMANVSHYPENLDAQNMWTCNLQDYRKRLERSERALFEDLAAQLELHQLVEGPSSKPHFEHQSVHTTARLSELLVDYTNSRRLPKCQHLYVPTVRVF